ncbi:S8 family peptidase [Janthinobacterium sp. MDB2-8]|uniref:S8 family peptidase n=1 Tax=Janthinobacterium sp. MDB2-8 TaxID=1259338 RepID=UPI003F20678F
MLTWRLMTSACMACMAALPVQAAPDAPPSWALHNKGGLIPVDLDQMQSYRIQAVVGQDIGLPGPTSATTTARKVVNVAIFDTGLDARHPAFAGLLARTDTSTPRMAASGDSPGYSDTDGSGTHLAGIVASVSQDIVIIPMQILQRASNAPVKPHLIDTVSERMSVDVVTMQELSQRVAAAIRSLADRPVQLILLPFGWPRTAATDPVAAAIADAQARGVLVVAASGNDASTTLPIPCQLSGVICVAASRPDGAIASFSNFGPGVDIAAPGVEIPGPIPVGRRSVRQPGYAYDNRSGTSQAAAMVADAAALLLSRGIPAADIYPRLVLGARPVLPETRLIEGPVNTSGHAVDSLDQHDMPLRSGQLDIAAALALPARALIMPANKEVKAIAWDGVAKTVALELALKNVWKSSPAARFAITIRPSGADTVLPSATIDRVSFNGNWPAQQEKSFAIHLRLPDPARTGLPIPSDLTYTVTVSINGVAQPAFDIGATLYRYVSKTMRGQHITSYPISGSLEAGMHLRRVEQSDLDRRPHSYLAMGPDPANPRAIRLALATSNNGKLALSAPTSIAINGLLEHCHVQQHNKLDINFDGKSEYILLLAEDRPASPAESPPDPQTAHLLILDEQMRLLAYQKIQDERFTTPMQVRWMRLGNVMRPAWTSEGEQLGPVYGPIDLLGQPRPAKPVKGPISRNLYYLDNTFRVAHLPLDATLHLFPIYFEETHTGQIPLLFTEQQTPCTSSFCSGVMQLAMLEDGKFQRDKRMNISKFCFFSDTLNGPLLDPAPGGHFAGLHWYARDAHHLLRLSFFNQRTRHIDQNMIAPTRAALDIAIAVTGAFQSERQSAAFVNTVHELQYHDFKTGQIATSRLNAYSFQGDHRYLPRQFPIVIRDISKHAEGRPALLIAAGQGEYRIALPAMTQAGKGNHIISPARWHLRNSTDCKALEEPVFLSTQSIYALDFFCGDSILRIAFAD